jgi:3-oxoacyl-[acyl-carrier-protein] synthase-3
VLEADEGEGTIADRGVLAASLRSDGVHKDKLWSTADRPRRRTVGICAWKAAKCSSTPSA